MHNNSNNKATIAALLYQVKSKLCKNGGDADNVLTFPKNHPSLPT